MTKKMLKFVDVKQETPVKRSTIKRKGDFKEIYNEFITDKAKEQRADVLNVVSLLSGPLSTTIIYPIG